MAQQNLRFLSLDQIETVSFFFYCYYILGPLIEISTTPVPQERVRGYD